MTEVRFRYLIFLEAIKNRNLLMDMPRNWLMRLSKVKSMQISWKN